MELLPLSSREGARAGSRTPHGATVNIAVVVTPCAQFSSCYVKSQRGAETITSGSFSPTQVQEMWQVSRALLAAGEQSKNTRQCMARVEVGLLSCDLWCFKKL